MYYLGEIYYDSKMLPKRFAQRVSPSRAVLVFKNPAIGLAPELTNLTNQYFKTKAR